MSNFKKPNLILAGFPKSGTTSFRKMLENHSEIATSNTVSHVYSWDNYYKKRDKIFNKAYRDLDQKYIMDSSTLYIASSNAISRIIKDTPNAKFIVLARDPIDRLISHFNWQSSLGNVNQSFKEEMSSHYDEKFDYKNHYNNAYKAYVHFSSYNLLVSNLIEKVPLENILFLTFEDTFYDWPAVRNRIFDFLSINFEDIQLKHRRKTNISSDKKNIIDSLKGERYQDFIRSLKGLPVGKKIRNSIKISVERQEVERIVWKYLKSDYENLKKTNWFNMNLWKTQKIDY